MANEVKVAQWALDAVSKLGWGRKKEILTIAVTEFKKSEKTASDYMGLIYASNYCLKPDNGLIWSQVQEIIESAMGEKTNE